MEIVNNVKNYIRDSEKKMEFYTLEKYAKYFLFIFEGYFSSRVFVNYPSSCLYNYMLAISYLCRTIIHSI